MAVFDARYFWALAGLLALLGLGLASGLDYALTQLAMVATFALAGLGPALIIGQAGQLTLGHGATLALGAYIETGLVAAGWSPMAALPLAALAGALLGALASLAGHRLSGVYFGLATLALALIVEELAMQLETLTGGGAGRVVPALRLFGWTLQSPLAQALLSSLSLVLALALTQRLLQSRQGRAWRALREDRFAAQCCGINDAVEIARVFMLAGAFGAWAGGLYAHWIGFVSPEQFGLMLSFELLILVFIGGLARLWGCVLGAALIVALPQLIGLLRDHWPALAASAGLELLLFGLMVVAVVLCFPQGLSSPSVFSRRRCADEPDRVR